jgi:hypothetical protein
MAAQKQASTCRPLNAWSLRERRQIPWRRCMKRRPRTLDALGRGACADDLCRDLVLTPGEWYLNQQQDHDPGGAGTMRRQVKSYQM